MNTQPLGVSFQRVQIATGQGPFRMPEGAVRKFPGNSQTLPQDFAPIMNAEANKPPATILPSGASNAQLWFPLGAGSVVQVVAVGTIENIPINGKFFIVVEEYAERADGSMGRSFSPQEVLDMSNSGFLVGAQSLPASSVVGVAAGIDPTTLKYADTINLSTDSTLGGAKLFGKQGGDGIRSMLFDVVGRPGLLFVGGPAVAMPWNLLVSIC